MSLPAKLTLGASVVVASSVIGYVHFKQYLDRKRLHDGVIRDVERQQRRKIENLYVLQEQIDLTKHLKKQMKEE